MNGIPLVRGVNRREVRNAVRVGVCCAAGLLLLVIALCGFLGIRSSMDVLAYYTMLREDYHPVWKDLALRRIRKGDSIDNLLKRHPPVVRDDFPPYIVLGYSERGSFNVLDLVAKDGRLLAAHAAGCTWTHIFFTTPAEEEVFGLAYSQHAQQWLLEATAYRIHLAITHGQDVFLSNRIERSQVSDAGKPARPKLAVEVTRVLHGNLKAGARLEFFGDECREADLDEPETVFLHFDDSRVVYPHSPEGPVYLTVPRRVLDWYQSLSADQLRELETKCLARRER